MNESADVDPKSNKDGGKFSKRVEKLCGRRYCVLYAIPPFPAMFPEPLPRQPLFLFSCTTDEKNPQRKPYTVKKDNLMINSRH